MDESKPSIPPSKFLPRSASERVCAANDPAPAELQKSAEVAAVKRQSCPGQLKVRRNGPPDGPSVAVYFRNEEEVREGFLIALRAMEFAVIEQPLEPAKAPAKGRKL